MITLGFTFSYSDVVTEGVAFPFPSSYIYVNTTAGDIVYQAPNGSYQWVQGAGLGYNPIAALMVVSSATVNGTPRTTSAVGMVYCCSPIY